MSPILTLSPFPRAHLGDLRGHDLKTADVSALIDLGNLLSESSRYLIKLVSVATNKFFISREIV